MTATMRPLSVIDYGKRVKNYLDEHIGDYPKVGLGYMDIDLAVFASATHIRLATRPINDERIRIIYPPVQMERTPNGLRLRGRRAGELRELAKSKFIVLGYEKPNQIRGELDVFRKALDLTGVLYIMPSSVVEEIGHDYIS